MWEEKSPYLHSVCLSSGACQSQHTDVHCCDTQDEPIFTHQKWSGVLRGQSLGSPWIPGSEAPPFLSELGGGYCESARPGSRGLMMTEHVSWAWPTYHLIESCVTPVRETLLCPSTEILGAKVTCPRSEPWRGPAGCC